MVITLINYLLTTPVSQRLIMNDSATVEVGRLITTVQNADMCGTIQRGFHDYITIVFCSIISCFGYPLNGLAIYQLHRTSGQRSQSRLTMLSFSMILANFLVLSFPCLGKAIWYLTYYWYGRLLLCKLYKYLESTAVFFMSNVMISVAVDMLCAFKWPFSDGPKRVNLLVMLSGVIALSLATPQLYFWTTRSMVVECGGENTTVSQCLMVPSNDTSVYTLYVWFHLTVIFWVPLGFLVPCYSCVLVIIIKQTNWHHRNSQASSTRTEITNSERGSFQTHFTSSQTSSVRSIGSLIVGSSFPQYSGRRRWRLRNPSRPALWRRRSESVVSRNRAQSSSISGTSTVPLIVKRRFRKSIQMVMRVVGIYIVLWLPYEMAAMFQFFFPNVFRNYENYLGWFYLLYLTNTCINPFMHAVRPIKSTAAIPACPSTVNQKTVGSIIDHTIGSPNKLSPAPDVKQNNRSSLCSTELSQTVPDDKILMTNGGRVRMESNTPSFKSIQSTKMTRENNPITVEKKHYSSPYRRTLLKQSSLVYEDDSMYSDNSLISPVSFV